MMEGSLRKSESREGAWASDLPYLPAPASRQGLPRPLAGLEG